MSKPTTIRLTIDEGPKKGETLSRIPGRGAIRIGRVVRGNTIAIRDPSISQKHLSVEFDPDTSRWAVTDLSTSNATSVNGVRVVPAVPFPLLDGDSVKIGGGTLISVRIENVGEEVAEGSRRIGGKMGRRGGPVRVSVVDDRIEPLKRGETVGVDETGDEDEMGRGRRRNSGRVLKKDEVLDPVCVEDEVGKRRRQNSSRVSKRDDIFDSVRVEDGTDAQLKLQRGRKGNCSRDLKVDEVLSTSLVVSSEKTAKVERRRKRGKCDSASKEDQDSDTVVVEHQIEAQDKDVDPVLVEDIAAAETRKKLPRVRRGNSSRVSKINEAIDIQAVDTVVADNSEAQERVGRKRRGILDKVSQNGEDLVPLVEVSIDAPKILPSGRRGNASKVLKRNGTMDTFVKESSELQENIGRGRRGVLSEVFQKGEGCSVLAVKGSTDVPKNLGRGRRSTRTQVLNKDEVLDSVAENIERPKTLRRGRTSSNMGFKKESGLDFTADSSTQVPKNLGKTRRTGSNKVLKDDEAIDIQTVDTVVADSSEVQERGGRERRGILDKISQKGEALVPLVEVSINVPKILPRGRGENSSRVLKTNETMDTFVKESSELQENIGRGRRGVLSEVSQKGEASVLDVKGSTDVPKNLGRGRMSTRTQVLNKDEVLDSVAEENVERPKTLRRGRTSSILGLKKESVLDFTADSSTKIAKNLGRTRRTCSNKVLKDDEAIDILTVDTVVADNSEARETVGRERRGIRDKVSQNGEDLVPLVEVSIDVPKILPSGRRGNSSRVLKTNGTMDTFVKESSELQENIGRGRRGVLSEVSQKGEGSVLAVKGSTDVSKNLGRGRRSTRTQVLNKNEVLDSVAEENIERPKTLRRGRTSSNMDLKKDSLLDFAADSSTQVPKNVGRTRRIGSNKVLKDDDISDSIVEESVKVPQDLKRGSRIGSSRMSKKNEIFDSVTADRTEDPVNLGRGKKRACSTRVSKKDNLVDLEEESIRVPEVGEGRPRRAPARRTRAASARLSTKEQFLESVPLNLKGPINPAENIHHHKELIGDSNQLGQSEKIQLVLLATLSPKEFNRSHHMEEFNKENHSLVSQRRENEEMMRSSCSKQIPDDEGLSSRSVSNVAEPSHVLVEVWNGNGIPNTTSKYKEDSKVSFHATPFEERLEKALSGEKHVTQRS